MCFYHLAENKLNSVMNTVILYFGDVDRTLSVAPISKGF